MEVKRIGLYNPIDSQGFLVNISQPQANSAKWLGVIKAIREAYLKQWGNLIHSIYIRGSLAKGIAQDYISDADSFAVLHKGILLDAEQKIELDAWEEAEEKSFLARFPFLKGLELMLEPLELALDRRQYLAATIKLDSSCIYGEDLASQIAPFRPNHELALQTRFIHFHIEQFLSQYSKANEEEKNLWLIWLMRRYLRLGMELIMEDEQKTSRDLYLCYESFAKHYPDKKAQMYHALELAIKPDTSEESLAFIQHLGDWLVAESNKQLRGWGYQQDREGYWVLT